MLFLPDEKVLGYISKTVECIMQMVREGRGSGQLFDRVGVEKYKEEVARPFVEIRWEEKKFILFLHSGNYEKLYQAVMLAITAASMGSKVYIFLSSGP